MAMLFRGMSKCLICDKIVEADQEATLFPHIITNEADPRYPLSDAACHCECVEASALGQSMLDLTDEYLKRAGPGNRKCAVCCEEIRDPDDYLMIGYLADPTNNAIGRFNFTHLHCSHIAKWDEVDAFLRLARNMMSEGRWRGVALPSIIRDIEAGMLRGARAIDGTLLR